MNNRSLAEVGARLERAAALLPDSSTNPDDIFDRLEQVAIAILDSEHADFIPGELEEYLNVRLYLRRLELGLIEFPDRDHQ